MGNSAKKEESDVENLNKVFKFFLKSELAPNPLMKKSFWTPYDEGDILYLESKFQEFQKEKKTMAEQFEQQRFQIDFKKWHEIDLNNPMNKNNSKSHSI